MSIRVFDVFRLVTISKNKITAIATDATHIYISCKDGKLMVFEMTNCRPIGSSIIRSGRSSIHRTTINSIALWNEKGSSYDEVRDEMESTLCSQR